MNTNKAWLNTNWPKHRIFLPYSSGIRLRIVRIFWETYRFNSREFFTFTCFHRLSTRNRIPPPLVLHRPFSTVECSLGYKQYLLFSFRVYKFWVCCEGTNKTRGGLGRVCATGMYRSIEHVKFPKFQTGILLNGKRPRFLSAHSCTCN